MNISRFSTEFIVRNLDRGDIPAVLVLCEGNPLYFEYCPPMATAETIADDMTALPPGMTKAQKYYVGFFLDSINNLSNNLSASAEKLIAVMDIIDGYPQPGTAFIGFFMTDAEAQNKGIGSRIISDCTAQLKSEGFDTIRLAWVKGNPQAEHFWLKNGFTPLKETSSSAAAHVILAEKKI